MNLELKPLKVAMLACCTLMIGEVAVAKTPAQANKVLNLAFEAPDDGFDMVKTYNFYSNSLNLPLLLILLSIFPLFKIYIFYISHQTNYS